MRTLGIGARSLRRWHAGVAGLALTAHAWSTPVQWVESPTPYYSASSPVFALAGFGTEVAPTPLMDSALSPGEFGSDQLPEALFDVETWDLDVGREFDGGFARRPLSRGAIALISRWVLTVQADDRVADIGTPASARVLNEPRVDRVAETSRPWSGADVGGGANTGGIDSAPSSHSEASRYDPPESQVLVSAMRPVVGFLRDNREWVLGIAAALALVVAYAGSQRGRRH